MDLAIVQQFIARKAPNVVHAGDLGPYRLRQVSHISRLADIVLLAGISGYRKPRVPWHALIRAVLVVTHHSACDEGIGTPRQRQAMECQRVRQMYYCSSVV
jgi:hypothetical protein